MPPVALMCLKYASEPQLSVSPICAYGPARASSLQTTMGELLLAEFPPPEPQAASPPAAKMTAAATAALTGIRLRIMVFPPGICLAGYIDCLGRGLRWALVAASTEGGWSAPDEERV